MAVSSTLKCRYLSSRNIAKRVFLEGDSYMAGAGGAGMHYALTSAGYFPIVSAVGGSTMAEACARITADAETFGLLPLIFWDGAQTDEATDVTAYAGQLADALALSGGTFVALPEATPFGTADDSDQIAIRNEYVRRWPTRTFDWRTVIPNTDGIIDEDQMLGYPGAPDPTHLNSGAHDAVVAGLQAAGLI